MNFRRRPFLARYLRPMHALCAWAALLCLYCGQDKVAGGYDDVENPALAVTLRDTLGKPYAAAELRVYARYQNPFKDSVPVFVRSIASGSTLTLRDTALLPAMAQSKLRGTPWPSKDSVEFNLVAADAGGEAFLGGFLLVKGTNGANRFQRGLTGSVDYPDAKGILSVTPLMTAPVLNMRGQIGARGLELKLKTIFIAGSPYRAQVEGDGSFTLARLAVGRYDVKAVSGDAKVYTAQDSLITGSAYAPSDWSEADIIWVDGP